ncbi:heparan-alpha-glucosaminide N-acetyltransferase-like [Dreissena polymorpha]|uniref:Heparan-alpha-glucosaminide N-acetyltransferase n=1 Tax=Dreissena polymorpha TaxID=45954 RepID=A0A9D4RMW0_DREPO|nr:heparan-alpha-glucosaminide N-acetyltransferase-like [Dreissena polymorpha]KAH3873028.1 hypothetical protein DPMN_036253 [Dreissena polymorpha]
MSKLWACLVGLLVIRCHAKMVPLCPLLSKPLGGMNVANLVVNKVGVNSTIVLQMITSECHKCALQNISYITEDNNCSVAVDTRWPMKMAVVGMGAPTDGNCSVDRLTFLFKESGVYILYVTQKGGNITCQPPVLDNDPGDNCVAIYAAFGIFAALAIIWLSIKKGRRACLNMLSNISPSTVNIVDSEIVAENDLGLPSTEEQERKPKKERLKSLDTFRGFSLVIMMFVNYGGANYWFFNHSIWNGLTVADLVFPWFIWIMGTALAFSFQSLHKSQASKLSIFVKICRRSVTLFALGILVNSGGSHNFHHWRIMGVLQRFALTYLVTATSQLLFMTNTDVQLSGVRATLKDLVLYWREWLVQLSLVLIHLTLALLLPVPGCPTGYLGPGGLANDGTNGSSAFNCTGGAAGYIDRQVFGDQLIYGSPTSKQVYQSTVPYDPEGLLGTLNSCFLCFLGLQAGKILIIYKEPGSRLRRYAVWAAGCGIVAAILCRFSKNDGWIPVNKNLWSLSYILSMACFAFVLFSACYLIVDVYKVWTGAPFFYPGMNSIVVYVCHEVFSRPFQTFWDIEPAFHSTYLLINVWDVTFWVLMSLFLYSNNVFINV